VNVRIGLAVYKESNRSFTLEHGSIVVLSGAVLVTSRGYPTRGFFLLEINVDSTEFNTS
jgi:hypothetical protein